MSTGDFVTDFNARRLERLVKGFPAPEGCRWILVSLDGTQTRTDASSCNASSDFGARPCLVHDEAGWSVYLIEDGQVLPCHHDDNWKPTYDVVDLLRKAHVWCSHQMLGEYDPADPLPELSARPQHSASYWRARCQVSNEDIIEAGDLGNPVVIGDCPEADAAVLEWALRQGIDRDDLDHGLIMVDWVINNFAVMMNRPAQDVLDEMVAIRRGLA